MNLQIYLDDIERRLNEQEEEAVLNSWKFFADRTNTDGPFELPHRRPSEPGIEWLKININDAIKDEELMILHQLAGISASLSSGSNRMHTVRSNYGVGIIPTVFGAEIFMMPYEMDTLPNVRHLNGDTIKRLIDSDFPDFKNGFGAKVLSVGGKYMEIKQKYPKIDRYIRIDHPDCQGPFDLCELMYGSDIFVDLYDNPERIHLLLRKITDFYKLFLDNWFSISPNSDSYHSYFGVLHRGNICVRDDSAMNLSPKFYEEFIYPYDYEVLKYFGGGAVHFCGKGSHFIKELSKMDCLYHVDLSQPEYNDMNLVFENIIDKGINLCTGKGGYWDSVDPERHRLSRLFLW
jgi:hypothetical protein